MGRRPLLDCGKLEVLAGPARWVLGAQGDLAVLSGDRRAGSWGEIRETHFPGQTWASPPVMVGAAQSQAPALIASIPRGAEKGMASPVEAGGQLCPLPSAPHQGSCAREANFLSE